MKHHDTVLGLHAHKSPSSSLEHNSDEFGVIEISSKQ